MLKELKIFIAIGYFNVKVKSTTAIINNLNQFELTFNINAGKKYFFDDVRIEENNNISREKLIEFEKKLADLSGAKYSKKLINELVNELNDFTLENDFIFVNANYKEIIKKENLIDIIITFDDIKKQYVERINILGNYITDEKVIRNSLIIDEGDAYNETLLKNLYQI